MKNKARREANNGKPWVLKKFVWTPKEERYTDMPDKLKSPLEHEIACELESDPTVDYFEYEPTTFSVILKTPHKVDFKVYPKDGEPYYVEAKGYLRPANRDLIARFREQHPDVDYRMIFENPHKKLSKGPRAWTYAKWCKRLDIPWGWTNRYNTEPDVEGF